MPRIAYQTFRFDPKTKATIAQANKIIAEYTASGFALTLRQLYYQFVARGFIANTMQSYKRLGSIINDGRLAGLIDWNAIEDRTRNLQGLSTWDSPASMIRSAEASFLIDKWATQDWHVEVWIEKDALTGVIAGVCNENQVDFFSCRGYTSQSEMWSAGQRLARYDQSVIIHLGDHDPSGLDMSRDIEERLNMFMSSGTLEFRRVALNMDQIQKYNPPPNPTKLTDSRSDKYVQQHGTDSWELDALDPKVISDLIQETIYEYRDPDQWDIQVEREEGMKAQLTKCREKWPQVVEFLNKL